MKIIKNVFLSGLVCLSLPSAHSKLSADEQKRPSASWEKAAVVRWTIIPRAVEGAPVRPDQNAVFQKLSHEAKARTERLLLKRRIAARVEQVESAQEATSPILVTGTVTLPTSLPEGVIGLKARSREGIFVVANVTLSDKTGKVLAREEASLKWNDVHWTYGARRKRNHTLDDVLAKFTRKAVDRALEQLVRHKFDSQQR